MEILRFDCCLRNRNTLPGLAQLDHGNVSAVAYKLYTTWNGFRQDGGEDSSQRGGGRRLLVGGPPEEHRWRWTTVSLTAERPVPGAPRRAAGHALLDPEQDQLPTCSAVRSDLRSRASCIWSTASLLAVEVFRSILRTSIYKPQLLNTQEL